MKKNLLLITGFIFTLLLVFNPFEAELKNQSFTDSKKPFHNDTLLLNKKVTLTNL